jgi:ADP-ribosylglycohydrolase
MTNIQNKLRGCLIGGAIGDALGYQIEFKRQIQEKQITRFLSPIGVISDDTQMTFFTANGLLCQKTQELSCDTITTPVEAVYHAYLDWFDTQEGYPNHKSKSWIKTIPELNVMRAPGNTCMSALHSKTMGTISKRINDSKGCGSLMRVAPCGMMAQSSQAAAILAAECAAITHGHTLGIVSAYIFGSMIYSLLYEKMNIEEALQSALNNLSKDRESFEDELTITEFVDLIETAMCLSEQDLSDIKAIESLGRGWVADEAFAIALYACLKYQNNFEDAIVCAINHDGDSDSTGAIAGNLMGALLGYSKIPDYYKYNVELQDIALTFADDIYSIRNENWQIDTEWKNKYIYNKRG